MKKLMGRNALVTGSGRSIGRAIAERLASEGANVAVNSRSTLSEAEATAEACRTHDIQSVAIVADVSQVQDTQHLIDEATRLLGPIDILVNNVGISPYVPFLELSDEDWETVIRVNLYSMYHCTRLALPSMVARRWGRVVNLTGHAYCNVGTAAHTSASKAAAMGFTRAIAAEFAPHGITCNEVAPGLIDTEPRRNKYYGDRKSPELRPWGSEDQAGEIPAQRLGRPEEVAAVCAFLCSDEAGYVTGQSYFVNGGKMWH